MKNKIEKFLEDYNLNSNDNTLIVAFSGGPDSMSLLHCLNEIAKTHHFTIVAAHLNHNWRGEESLNEANFCKNFCLLNEIEFYTETLDKNEKQTETRARELRYDFFERVIQKYNAKALFTAHTKSDIAETILYRLIKGTGIKGLQGISPKLNKIYRPLLEISRQEIEAYCKKYNLSTTTDSSNLDNKYSRNYIRNEVLPLFEKINPKYEKALFTLSNLAYENEQIIEEYISSLNIYQENKILTPIFKELTCTLQKRIIYDLFVNYDFEYTQDKIENTLKFIKENINSKSGKITSITNNEFIFVNQKFIEVIKKNNKILDEIQILKEGHYTLNKYKFSIEKCNDDVTNFPKDDEFIACIELTEPINFVLRTRKNGDKITPLGQTHATKLKKYFINKNIPQHEKDSIILLCKDAEVLWASGLGINDKIKVVNKCTHVLTLKKE